MPEILTESFCERCGTRYTFEAAAPKGKRLGKLKVFSKGFVNFVSNDESSLDEALADARSDEQRELTTRQLDAFHQTFQFCLSCRQYTCANCWNDTESRCLSCAPHLGQDVFAAPFPALDSMTGIGFALPTNGSAEAADDNGAGVDAAWPATDVAQPASSPPTDEAGLDLPALTAGAEEPATIDAEPVDDDVARAVAEAELARLAHDRAEAEAEQARQAEAAAAAAAEQAQAAELAAEAELARQAQAAADADAERLRQAAAQAEAEQARRARELEEAERLRQAAAARADAEEALLAEELKEARRLRQAAAAEEVERVRLSTEVEAELARRAQAEVEAERLRQAKADAEWAQAVAEADRLQRIAAEAEADRARQAQAEAEAERTRQAQAAADAEAERARQAAADADRAREAAARAASAAQRPDDRVGPAIWQIVAPEPSATPELSPLDAPPAILAPQPPLPLRPAAGGAATPPPAGGPAWPTPTKPSPQWPIPPAGDAPTWPAQQMAGAASGTAGLWAASSEDVINKPGPTGVQACLSCGLPLSASARFCRRCGTQQH
ncbi:MAG: hypothetical protein ACXWWR_02385 [Candidatus Limnocylindrales bacterium]